MPSAPPVTVTVGVVLMAGCHRRCTNDRDDQFVGSDYAALSLRSAAAVYAVKIGVTNVTSVGVLLHVSLSTPSKMY